MSEPGDDLRAAAADFRGALARLDTELVDLELLPAASARVDDNCAALLAVLRKRCPGLVPALDVPPGTVGDPVPIPADNAGTLIVGALQQAIVIAATGKPPARDAQLPAVVHWREGADALLVEVARCQVQITDGEIALVVPVRCDQLERQVDQVVIRFVVGTADRPTGMFAITTAHPIGPPVVVQRWGDALTALAWQALLDVAHGVSSHAGRDADGGGMVPVALVAAPNGLLVLPQARHAIDRVVGA